jgi:hypothetical protein
MTVQQVVRNIPLTRWRVMWMSIILIIATLLCTLIASTPSLTTTIHVAPTTRESESIASIDTRIHFEKDNEKNHSLIKGRSDSITHRRSLLSSSSGPRHFNLNRIDANLNEHQRNNRRLFYRARRNERIQRRRDRSLYDPITQKSANSHKPPGSVHSTLPPYQAEATLKAENDGVYYTVVRIGTHERGQGTPFTLIADTGSSSIAVPCKGCNCGLTKHYFDIYNSGGSTRDTKNMYSQCYGEGSCNSGKLIQDVMCFGPKCLAAGGVMQVFGCCSKYAPSFQAQEADGIIGLGHSNTLVKALQKGGELLAHQFALCIGKSAGRLTVGGCELDDVAVLYLLY